MPHRPPDVSPWPFVGMGALVCVLFLDGAAALFAPWWVVALLVFVWVGLFVQACRWWTPLTTRLVWLAAAALALWLVVAVAGGIWLDWRL